MNKLLAVFATGFVLGLGAQPAAAQAPGAEAAQTGAGLDGDWDGAFDNGPNGKARVIVHIRTSAQGLGGTVDSPDHNLSDLPISSLTRDGDRVRFKLDLLEGVFEGSIDSSGRTLTGQ